MPREIGGGNKMFDIGESVGGALEAHLKTAQLANALSQKNKDAIDIKLKEIDLGLKGNQLLQIDIDNEKKQADLTSALNDERRKQSQFVRDQLKEVTGLFGKNFELGKVVFEQSFPGSVAAQNKDGTVTAVFQTPEGIKSFTLNPANASLDPKQKSDLENSYRDEWTKSAGDYKTQNNFFRAMNDLSKLGTAQADVGIVFSYMKILDPRSTVREGEVATAQNTPGVPERVRNMYNRSMTQDAPLFGEVGSITRKKFVDAANSLVQSSKKDAAASGQFFYDVAKRGNLDPKNILVPVGDISISSFETAPAEEKQTTDQYLGKFPRPAPKAPTQNAAVPGAGGTNPETPRPRPTKTLDEVLEKNLFR